jgi:hypothetical protein
MLHFSPGAAGGLAVGAAAAVAAVFTFATATHSDSASSASAKAGRLPVNIQAAAGERRIAVVEVVGVRDAAIVYRDRDGRVLYSTDPVANVTVVAKNLTLPEVTVRESADSKVQRVPIENMRAPEGDKPKEGCETGLSPDISPTVPVTKGRCIVEKKPTSDVASLR